MDVPDVPNFQDGDCGPFHPSTHGHDDPQSSRCTNDATKRELARNALCNGERVEAGENAGIEFAESEIVELSKVDLPYLSGTKAITLKRIASASGATIGVIEKGPAIRISGSAQQRQHAKLYIRYIIASALGPVSVEEADLKNRGIIVRVPYQAIPLVLGRQKTFLKTCEDRWKVLMFLAIYQGSSIIGGNDQHTNCQLIAIFGDKRGRRGAQLDVMSAVEKQVYRYYTYRTEADAEAYDDHYRDGDLGTSMLWLSDEDIVVALGTKEMTRRKISSASGALMHTATNIVFLSGTKKQRKRAKEYINWLFEQQRGDVVVNTEGRNDVSLVDVPLDSVDSLYGESRSTFTRLEDEWGVLMFFAGEVADALEICKLRTRRLLIFGPERSRLGATFDLWRYIENFVPGFLSRGIKEKASERDAFDTERVVVLCGRMPHVVGPDGVRRENIQAASGAICQAVGEMLWIAGNLQERRRCKEYVQWILRVADALPVQIDARGRNDITEIAVPSSAKLWVSGAGGSELRRVECESRTICIWANDHLGEERLCIFSHALGEDGDAYGRAKAETQIMELIQLKSEYDRRERCSRVRSRSPSNQTGRQGG